MSRDPTIPPGDLNHHAPTGGTFRPDLSVVPPSVPPPRGTSLAILHDLTDRELKRFPDCDLFYDPRPLLGVVPQWLILVTIFAALGVGVGWSLWRLVPQGIVLGGAAATLIGGLAVMATAGTRAAARDGGFLDGRRITISDNGLRVDYPGSPDANGPTRSKLVQRQMTALACHPVLKTTGLAEGVYDWWQFRAVEFRRDYLILWLQGRRRLVIPVRAFGSVDEAEGFARAAAGWIGAWG